MRALPAAWHRVPDPGTTDTNNGTDAGTSRGGTGYAFGQQCWRYADYASWNVDPDLVVIYVQGLYFASPIAYATIVDNIFQQSQDTYGTSVVMPIDYGAGPVGLTHVKAAGDYVKSFWGASQPFIYAGHSAGGQWAGIAAHYHNVPMILANTIHRWENMSIDGDYGTAWNTAAANLGVTRGEEEPWWDIPYGPDSPPVYIIGSDLDEVVHPDCHTNIVAYLAKRNIPFHYDLVDTGTAGQRTHSDFWDQVNMDDLRSWFDDVARSQ